MARGVVIGLLAKGMDSPFVVLMACRFAALMVQQMAYVRDVAAVSCRRADNRMRFGKIGNDESSGPSNCRTRRVCKDFPAHASV